ncbi:MAG: hypothetical protein L6R42_007248 [Xanthoria sp. 1 TBL-2021]|nr:MAG: hypothetical protein L6R42_007248 [Xanthoria sp. 1 TBL-2021]
MAAVVPCSRVVINTRIPPPVGLRAFSTAQSLASGHNRWSKIKHDKIKEDVSLSKYLECTLIALRLHALTNLPQAVRSKERSQWSRSIQEAVRKHGADPTTNSELSTLVAQAKKTGFPKDLIERAIAKGRGLSLSGHPLQALTVEAMLPPSVSTIIECQTDNKKRTLEDLRLLVKEAGGMVTPTSHHFDRRGHILLKSTRELEEEHIMEQVLEAGALDLELGEDPKSLSVYTEPNETASIAQSLSASLGLTLGNYEIIWVARPESVIDIEGMEEEPRLALDDIIGVLSYSSIRPLPSANRK